MEIKDKIVIITGSAKRVGKAIALALATSGAHIVVHYRHSRDEAEKTALEIEKLGVKSLAIKANISSASEVKAMIMQVIKHFGRIDVLINNAAIYYATPFEHLTEKEWDDMIDINLKGSFLTSKYAADEMLKTGGGKIINIADWNASRPNLDYLPYCVSKAGVVALTENLALTLAPKIQVNCIAPGPVLLGDNFTESEQEESNCKTLLKRIGTPRDVVSAVKFLIEGSDFTTGSTVTIDGGKSISH